MSDKSIREQLAISLAADARMYLLRELRRQPDERMSDLMLHRVLDAYGLRVDRDWVRTQLRKLEQLGAIVMTPAGETLFAQLTETGRNHVDQRAVLEGVSRPSDID